VAPGLIALVLAAAPVKLAAPGLTYVGLEPAMGEVLFERFVAVISEQGDVAVTTTKDLNQLLGVGIGQWLEQVHVQDAEHRGVGTDAEGQRHDSDGGKPWRASKGSSRVAEILKKIVRHSGLIGRIEVRKGW